MEGRINTCYPFPTQSFQQEYLLQRPRWQHYLRHYYHKSSLQSLKKYNTQWTVRALSTSCDYCDGDIPSGSLREYANYCPKCHKWGYLRLETQNYNNSERRFFHCDSCQEDYCVNCSISQGKSFIKSFLNDNVFYGDFINKYKKMTHIRDD